jgi:hypothetical protein
VTSSGQQVRSGFRLFDVAVDRDSEHLYAVWEQIFIANQTFPVQVAFSRSVDGGSTWSSPSRIDQAPPDPVFVLEQSFLPSVHVSDAGTVGVTYYNFENDMLDPSAAHTDYWFIACNPESDDCTDGTSWANALRLTPEPFDYLPAIPEPAGLFLGDYMGLASSGSDFLSLLVVIDPEERQRTTFVPIRAR